MDFRIIELPPFEAVSSGVDPDFDFGANGTLGRFDAYFSKITPLPRDRFRPRDFLFFDKEKNGFVWWWALSEGMDDGGFPHVQFDGGYYLSYNYVDHDEETNGRLYQEALRYIAESGVFALDERPNHYSMGHIITPAAIAKQQGFAVMETFIPIKIKLQQGAEND